jgi:hypothetical protein
MQNMTRDQRLVSDLKVLLFSRLLLGRLELANFLPDLLVFNINK